jgi:hypothetical protein
LDDAVDGPGCWSSRRRTGRSPVAPRAAPASAVRRDQGSGPLWRRTRVAREDPATMAPGPERILAEPPPEGGPADLRDEPLGHHFSSQFGQRPARQRHTPAGRQLTGEGFDLDDDAGGKSGLGARRGAAPPAPGG